MNTKTDSREKTIRATPGFWTREGWNICSGSAVLAKVQTTPEMEHIDEGNIRLMVNAPRLKKALEDLILDLDVECYCANNVAAKGPCAACCARGLLGSLYNAK